MAPKGGGRRDKRSTSPLDNGYGCSVPKGLMLCLHPVPDGPEAKIRMSCSSIQCPETSLALHSDCYDKLEKLLIQAAAGNARCRNWSEAQIRMNLWNKKVYDILFRLCGCKCGHGYLKHEEEIILPPPKPVQMKKTLSKGQLKPELKDVKLKKAKKLSTKSALSESLKRHQDGKKEMAGEKETSPEQSAPVANAEVYIPGLATKNKTRKKARKSSLESDCSTPPPVILNPGVMPFVPRYSSMESEPDFELFYSSSDDDEEMEEDDQMKESWKSSSILDDPAVLSSQSSEAGLREGILRESNSPVDEGMESPNNDEKKHADSLIESIEILLNMDEEKSSNKSLQNYTLPPSLSKSLTENPAKAEEEDNTVRISSQDAILSKKAELATNEYFETESKPKSKVEAEVELRGNTPTDQTMVLTPQWKSDINGCFSCEMFPHPSSLAEVRRKEGPRHRRKVGEACKHCLATINGQANFLKFYQARNGPFKTQSKPNVIASGSEPRLKEVTGERQNKETSCETDRSWNHPGSGGTFLKTEIKAPGELAQAIARLKRELFDARVKQIAYMALNLALENMTPVVCSN